MRFGKTHAQREAAEKAKKQWQRTFVWFPTKCVTFVRIGYPAGGKAEAGWGYVYFNESRDNGWVWGFCYVRNGYEYTDKLPENQ